MSVFYCIKQIHLIAAMKGYLNRPQFQDFYLQLATVNQLFPC